MTASCGDPTCFCARSLVSAPTNAEQEFHDARSDANALVVPEELRNVAHLPTVARVPPLTLREANLIARRVEADRRRPTLALVPSGRPRIRRPRSQWTWRNHLAEWLRRLADAMEPA